MEINKLILNGVEYEITDTQAHLITELLSKRVDYLETETARLDKKIDENVGKLYLIDIEEIKESQQELKEALSWKMCK